MEFKSPLFFILILLLVPLLTWAYFRRRPLAFSFSSSSLLSGIKPTWKMRLQHVPFFLRLLTICLFVIALAGPRKALSESKSSVEGINIELLLDTSTSMAALDFTVNNKRVNRLEVVKNVIHDFVEKRTNDRIGLIAFAARPYTVSPLTADHAFLEANLERVRFGLMEDGTAIGSAIASGTNRLRTLEGKSKILVLLTDGVNNAGKIDPLSAAKAAKTLGVKIYTIGVGTRGPVPYPVTDMFGRSGYQMVNLEIDEDILKKIADETGGQYFRATDTESLKGIYDQIDKLETVKFEETGYRQYEEFFDRFLILALLVLLAEVILGRTVFLKIP